MCRRTYRSRIFILSLLIITVFAGCRKENKAPNTYNLEDFKDAMTNKGYTFEVQNVEQDFLPTTRNRMTINNLVLDIYIFNSDEEMESEAKNIDSDGSGYSNGSLALKVSWVSFPHFYKKGSLIVQYVGEDKTITAVLTDILGDQFAGY